MWTDESKEAYLIAEVVGDKFAQSLLFQARVNLELFTYSKAELHKSLDKLNFHNFAGAFDTSHMNSGVFGAAIHASNKITYTQRTLGFLLATVTAGHRMIKSLRYARDKDDGTDWKIVRKDFKQLEGSYTRTRNALEHLPDAIKNGKLIENKEFGFSPEAILTAKDKAGRVFTFDFSEKALNKPIALYSKVFEMLSSRKDLN